MKPSLQKQHVTYRFHTTGTTLTVMCAWFDLWWVYAGEGSRKHHLPPMNRFPNVFRYAGEAELRSFIMAAYSLYDPGPGRVTLPGFLKELPLDAPTMKRAKEFIRRGNVIALKLKPLRHWLIAHRSDKHTFQDAYREAGIKPNELSRLITLSCAAYNSMAKAAEQNKFYRTNFARDELLSMLEDLRGSKDAG